MASIPSLISDIQKLSLTQQEQLISYLEEILVVGSQVNQVTQEVKEFRFAKGKVCPHCNAETVSRNGKYKINSVIFVNLVIRLLLTSQTLLLIRARNHWIDSLNMLNV
jgi:hypothetical protein